MELSEITAKEFGIRIARVFNESRSSNAFFFIQQALGDIEDCEFGIEWNEAEELLEQIVKEGT